MNRLLNQENYFEHMKNSTTPIILAVALLSFSSRGFSQNLVTNGDFDATSDAPRTAFVPAPWFPATGTPDLVDADYVVVTTPANAGGWLAASDSPDSGNFVGMYASSFGGERLSQNLRGCLKNHLPADFNLY